MSLEVMSNLLSAMSKVIIRIVIVSLLGRVKGQSKSRASEKCFTRIGSGLTPKPWTGLEGLARDKHSSLYGTFVKSFITLAPDFKSENIFETFSLEG